MPERQRRQWKAGQQIARDIGEADIVMQLTMAHADSHTGHDTWVTARPEVSNHEGGT